MDVTLFYEDFQNIFPTFDEMIDYCEEHWPSDYVRPNYDDPQVVDILDFIDSYNFSDWIKELFIKAGKTAKDYFEMIAHQREVQRIWAAEMAKYF